MKHKVTLLFLLTIIVSNLVLISGSFVSEKQTYFILACLAALNEYYVRHLIKQCFKEETGSPTMTKAIKNAFRITGLLVGVVLIFFYFVPWTMRRSIIVSLVIAQNTYILHYIRSRFNKKIA